MTGSQELRLATNFPQVRLFMVALTHNESQQTDLTAVALPWSVPTAGLFDALFSITYRAIAGILRREGTACINTRMKSLKELVRWYKRWLLLTNGRKEAESLD